MIKPIFHTIVWKWIVCEVWLILSLTLENLNHSVCLDHEACFASRSWKNDTSCNFDEPTPRMIKESAFYFWCWYSKLCFVCSRQHLVLILIHLSVALFHWASVPGLRGRHTTSTDSGRCFRRGRTKNPDWITMRFSACFIQLLSWLCCIQMRCWRSAKTIMCHFMFYSLKKAQTDFFSPLPFM